MSVATTEKPRRRRSFVARTALARSVDLDGSSIAGLTAGVDTGSG
jgi:hypothetical protein